MFYLEQWRGPVFQAKIDIICNLANHKIKYLQYHYWPTVGRVAQYGFKKKDLKIKKRGTKDKKELESDMAGCTDASCERSAGRLIDMIEGGKKTPLN